MNDASQETLPDGGSRRSFLKKTSAGLVGGALATGIASAVHAAGKDGGKIKIALIGCGGRGTGAAGNALKAGKDIQLVAMADAFDDRLQRSLRGVSRRFKNQVNVPKEHQFVGLNAYKKVMAMKEVDVVLLTTPPHFRPVMYRAAIEAGKHCFVEKPVAVDAPGYRSVVETNKMADEKKLSVVSGLCWRYDYPVRETIKRIQDGAIGDIVTIQENYNTGTLWSNVRKKEWTEMEYQLRNWLYYTWLSGDMNNEQHIHSLDKASWLMGDKPPVRATGLGGRQVRTAKLFGNIYDHHAVCYEYANGVRVFSYCRQMARTSNNTEDYIFGTKGQAKVLRNEIVTGDKKWNYSGKKKSMYDVEHEFLFESIRNAKPINNGHYMATSTMLAIMGRMSTYTGQTITWEQAINSKESLGPKEWAFGDIPRPAVAMPGVTKFV